MNNPYNGVPIMTTPVTAKDPPPRAMDPFTALPGQDRKQIMAQDFGACLEERRSPLFYDVAASGMSTMTLANGQVVPIQDPSLQAMAWEGTTVLPPALVPMDVRMASREDAARRSHQRLCSSNAQLAKNVFGGGGGGGGGGYQGQYY